MFGVGNCESLFHLDPSAPMETILMTLIENPGSLVLTTSLQTPQNRNGEIPSLPFLSCVVDATGLVEDIQAMRYPV